MRLKLIPLLLILAATAANLAANIPQMLDFSRFAFGDQGWALTVDALLDDGLAPTQDFAYFYGLLTLLIDRAWFAALGRTPEAVVALYAVCNLATGVGVFRVLRAAGVGPLSWAIGIAALPLTAVPGLYSSPAHAMEPALLLNALAFQIRGRLDWALVLATLAVFVKPSLGYVYGLLLVLQVLSGWPIRVPNRLGQFVPAAVTAGALAGVLSAYFGWGAVIQTQLPFDAGKAYREADHGFFQGVGRMFWQPEQPSPGYYVRTPFGPWALASVAVLFGALKAVARPAEPGRWFVVTCAALHAAFVCLLYGNQWSWIYYPFLPFLGAAVAVDRFGRAGHDDSGAAWVWRSGGWALVIWLLVVALLWMGLGCARQWKEDRRSPATAGLYASPRNQSAWESVSRLSAQERVFILTRMGCAPLLTPGLEGPRSWCLIRAVATPAEMDWVRDHLRTTNWVLAPKWHDNDLMKWPEFAGQLAAFRAVLDCPSFVLYQRQAPPGS